MCIAGTATYAANTVVLSGGTGAWSSSATGVATVNASGLVTGVTAGTANIIYTITGGCGGTISAQQSVTISPNASIGSVTGTSPLCDGGTATYNANSVVLSGGIGGWVSSNYFVANVDIVTGLVTGVSTGTANIIYAIIGGCGSGFVTAQQSVTISPNASIASVTGTSPLCIAGTATYAANTVVLSGGTGAWSSSATGVATVNASGLVTGVTAGTANIIYTITGGCGGTKTAQQSVTISPNASIASVTGTSPLCIAGTATYAANTVVLSGGTGAWSSSATGVATVNASGLVTGVTAGTANIIYTITGGCGGTKTAQQSVTISPNASIASVTGTSPLCIAGTATYAANTVVLSGGTGAWSSSATGVATVNASGLVTGVTAGTANIIYTITGGCGGTKTAQQSVTISPNASIASVTGTSPLCIAGTATYAANTVVLSGGTGAWSSSATGVATVNASGLVTGVTAGTANIIYTITGGCGGTKTAQQSVTINAIPTAPIIGTIIDPTCTNNTGGSITLNSLPSGSWTLTQSGTSSGTFSGTGISNVVSGLSPGTYYFTVAIGSCLSTTSNAAIVDKYSTIWNGSVSGWSDGVPNLNKSAEFKANYNSITDGGSLSACSVTITAGTVLFNENDILTVQNEVNIVSGSLIFENNSSLVQINNVTNTGNITYKRIAQQKKNDYVFWSSPVENFNLSSHPSDGAKYTWGTTFSNSNGTQGNWIGVSGIMNSGQGYIVGGPTTFNNTTNQNLEVPFFGKPRNGDIPVTIYRGSNNGGATYTLPSGAQVSSLDDNWNLLGNPYPSAISCKSFLLNNSGVLTGALFVWTHSSLPSSSVANSFYSNFSYNYNPNDYVPYNLTGNLAGVGADYYIGAGQGFFVTMKDGAAGSGTVNFTNSLRSNTYGNNTGTNFFRTSNTNNTITEESHRIWLDLIKDSQTTRTLIGYVTGATMGDDNLFDAKSKKDNNLKIYSIADDVSFIIQGRALPFNDTDQVKIGVDIYEIGTYTIAIGLADGLFLNNSQNIFLEDKYLNVIYDLKQAPYSFASSVGTFTDRFVLRYDNTSLSNPNIQVDNTFAFITNNSIKVQSIEDIKQISIYDISGKLIFNNILDVSVNHFERDFPYANGVYIASIVLNNGSIVTKKLIN